MPNKRLLLHQQLFVFANNLYFQPPSNVLMKYPCIVYEKATPDKKNANNRTYVSSDEYQITVIERDPDSNTADDIVAAIPYSAIANRFVTDNLYHTIIKLYI